MVSAMEAVGVMELMTKFNANKKPAKKVCADADQSRG